MGLSKNEFMHSTPKILKAYDKAYIIRLKEIDQMAHMFVGNYVISAFATLLDRCFNGKNAKTEYIKEPVLINADNATKELTEEEMEAQRMAFMATLQTMKVNFDLAHKNKSEI